MNGSATDAGPALGAPADAGTAPGAGGQAQPAPEPSAPSVALSGAPDEQPGPAELLPRMRVLAVDDEETSLVAISAALDGLGVDLMTVQSGREALRAVLLNDFAVILLDVRMPLMDGFETAELIRERPRSRETPIIFLTGADTQMLQAYTLGAVDYLVKPFPTEALRSKVRVFVELAEARARLALQARRDAARAATSEDKYRELMALALDAILVLDAEGTVIEANRRAETLFDVFEGQLVGTRFANMFEAAAAGTIEAVSGTRGGAGELAVTQASGERRWCEVSVTPVQPGGTPLALAIVHDVTERRRVADAIREMNVQLEQQVEERTRQLRISNEELEAFSYSVAHDLRAPLRSIIGYSNMIAEEYGRTIQGQGRGWLDTIAASTRRMSQLIDDLLDLSRVARSQIHCETVDVTALSYDLLGELARTDPGRQVEVEVDDGLSVAADPTLLRLAIGNLLSNAWKFTRTRERAQVRVLRHPTMTGVFCVRDNGVGFDERYASKMFEPFERLHVNDFDGTGIGLAIVDRVVRRHGGRVWAESVPEGGASFYVAM